MDEITDEIKSYRKEHALIFFTIILIILIIYLVVELLVTRYILHTTLTIIESIIPTSILYSIFFTLTLLYARRTRTTNYEMGLHFHYFPKSLIVGIFATSGYLLIVLLFRMPLMYTSVFDILILTLLTLIIGLVEETIFRGYIQANLAVSMPRLLGVSITAILFACLHIPKSIVSGNYIGLLQVPIIFFLGWLLGYTRIYTGNIWAVVVAHMTWNYYTFLFTPQIYYDIADLIPSLIATGAMWGTFITTMFIARVWIDRPDQRVRELKQEYIEKIQWIGKRILEFQRNITKLEKIDPNLPEITKLEERIKRARRFIEIYQEHTPQLNELNYKIIQKIISHKRFLIRLDDLAKKTRDSNFYQRIELKRTEIWDEIESLINSLRNLKSPSL